MSDFWTDLLTIYWFNFKTIDLFIGRIPGLSHSVSYLDEGNENTR